MEKHIFNIVCTKDIVGKDSRYTRVKLEHQDDREKTITFHGPYFESYSLSVINNELLFDLWIEKGKYNLHKENIISMKITSIITSQMESFIRKNPFHSRMLD